MQQLADNMVLELSATKQKASSKRDGEELSEKIDKVGDWGLTVGSPRQ